MKKTKVAKYVGRRGIYTILAAIILCIVCVVAMLVVYNSQIEENYEQLHLQTKQYKRDIKLQMESDQENLITMARFAEKLYEGGEDFGLIYKSFKEIGLLSEIGVLLPDGTFITKRGETKVSGVSFSEEAAKGKYISGKVEDFTTPGRHIIRSAVPVMSEDKPIAILYGLTDLDDLEARYKENIEGIEAHLYIFEAGTGEILLDTVNPTRDNISILKNRKYLGGHTYKEMMDNVSKNESGYTEFVSRMTKEDLYVHYSPIGLSDWYIILARPSRVVFQNAHGNAIILISMFAILLIVGAIYMLLIMKSERKMANLNDNASGIRKLLLEINHKNSSINEALKGINDYSKSRSVIFADTDGQLHKYAAPGEKKLFTEEEQRHFVSKMLEFAREHNDNNNNCEGEITSFEFKVSANGQRSEFEEFLHTHGIESIGFTIIVDRSNHIGILAVLNAKNLVMAKALLEKIGVCFSIAIYNRKHLKNTELASQTDSLTGLSNRTAYKIDAEAREAKRPGNFACIYVDVNELHLFNNKNGHAAGDAMLIYVANTLKEIFYGSSIYRMGGDEFLVFTEGVSENTIKENLQKAKTMVEEMNYHISVGYVYKKILINLEEVVNEAEIRMYQDKAMYYQNKELLTVHSQKRQNFDFVRTGIREVDKTLEVMSQRYSGIYSVSMEEDKAQRILMPSDSGYDESEASFSKLFSKYVNENVVADYRRAVLSFLNYDAIKAQLASGSVPRITYTKVNGEKIVLSVYKLDNDSKDCNNALVVFEIIG